MTEQNGYEEAVMLFGADLTGIELELTARDFTALVQRDGLLEQYAASVVRAAFAVVGAALSVRAVVFFTFKVDEEGAVDPHFNLPLRYLADTAGQGPDLGAGPVRLSCRGKCSVPWHSVNLWEPVSGGETDSMQLVQRTIWRNRLGLKPSGPLGRVQDDGLELVENGFEPDQRVLETRLTETFGEEGRVSLENLIRQHNEKLTKVSEKYRQELATQQQGYLEQIKNCREEIQSLKSALRHEQQRSRRLQELLRGEP